LDSRVRLRIPVRQRKPRNATDSRMAQCRRQLMLAHQPMRDSAEELQLPVLHRVFEQVEVAETFIFHREEDENKI
jgi:hypothetical protein